MRRSNGLTADSKASYWRSMIFMDLIGGTTIEQRLHEAGMAANAEKPLVAAGRAVVHFRLCGSHGHPAAGDPAVFRIQQAGCGDVQRPVVFAAIIPVDHR